MSIADKLTYLNQTKQLIKESINLTGANITNEPFRDYAVMLRNKLPELVGDPSPIWFNYEHVSGSGTSFSINSYNSIFNYNIKGDTVQDGTPTPDAPIPVNVVSGNNEINICGKNLIPFTNQDFTLKNIRYYVQDGSLYVDGTSAGETSTTDINFKNNFAFTLQAGTYTFSQQTGNVLSKYLKNYSDNSNIAILNGNNRTGTFTLNSETKVYLAFYVYNYSTTNEDLQIMLKQGTSSPTYEPYIGHSYTISLGTMELCKIGDYQDYIYKDNGSWYLHKEIGKVVLDGTETINVEGSGYTAQGRFQFENIVCKKGESSSPNAMSNYFNSNFAVTNGSIFVSGVNGYINAMNTSYTNDLAGFKTWLGNTKPIVYYVLANPTSTEITDANLILQLNSVRLINGLNNITTVGSDLNPLLNIEAIKYID